jgi:hypothetical protein
MHRQLVLERSFLTIIVGYRGELGGSCRPRDLYPMLRVFPGIAPTPFYIAAGEANSMPCISAFAGRTQAMLTGCLCVR